MMIHVHIEDRQFNMLAELLLLNIAETKKLVDFAQQQTKLLQQIHDLLAPALPVKFEVVITTQGDSMSKAKFGKMKITFLDNGTAKAVATPTDAMGLATTLPAGTGTPTWASSDAGMVVTPDASDASGLTAILSPATPPVLVTGAIPTVTAVLADGTNISGSGEACNITAGGPTGFKVVEA